MADILALTANAAALFLCWLFAVAAAHKLDAQNSLYYKVIMAGYGVEGTRRVRWLTRIIGAVEMLIALAVLLPLSRHIGAAAAALALAGYALLMSAQLARGNADLDCGCEGPESGLKLSWPLVARNLLLCLLALLAYTGSPASGVGYWALSVAFGALLWLAYLSSGQLLANWQLMVDHRRHLSRG